MSVDFYTLIHKAIRRRLFEVVAQAGALDAGDDDAFSSFRADLTTVIAFLRDHARHEDEFFQPLLLKYVPDVGAALADEHREHHEELDAIEALLASTSATPREQRTTLALYRALARFAGQTLLHLDAEEASLPALWAHAPMEELARSYAAFIASMPPEEAQASMVLILAAVNPAERRMLEARRRAA